MIRIIKDAALTRQGTDRSDPSAGDEFLRDWEVDMSNCRTDMHLVEIIDLILAAPNGKQPGPDGVSSEFFKTYAKTLAPLFQEGWKELLQGTYSDPDYLGCRKWTVIPKAANVRTTDKLRDLEMTNVVRKTSARMANRVLDEVFRTQLCSAQQAFYSSGDITRNLVMLHTLFRDYQHLFPHDLLVLLSLDCSKAYNRVGWSWLRRCLTASRLPASLQRLLLAFLPGTVHLVFRGSETAAVSFLSGLAQGCPLSCFLYLLVIDPLLHKIRKHPGVL